MANPKIKIDILADPDNFTKGISKAEKAAGGLHGILSKLGLQGGIFGKILDKVGIGGIAAGVSLGSVAAVGNDLVGSFLKAADAVRKYQQVTGESAAESS